MTTTISTTATRTNPFDLPELRHRLTHFVALKDACSCALVSKAWTTDFVALIWFAIDFNIHPRFAQLTSDIVAKHGRHIRIVNNAKSFAQVSVLANAAVHDLKRLHIDPTFSAIEQARAYEIIFRNSASLENLHLYTTSIPMNKLESWKHHVSAPALAPFSCGGAHQGSSKLKTLAITGMWLTHDSLVMILQGCPRLTELRLAYTDVVGTPSQSFQHTGINYFSSVLKNIFPDFSSNSTSTLTYLPNLTTLHTCNYNVNGTMPSDRIKKELFRYCPRITGFKLEDYTGAIVSEFLTNIANNVSEICFQYRNTTTDTITAILLHQRTLKIVKHLTAQQDLDFEKDEVAPVKNPSPVSGYAFQLIPRQCSLLEELNLNCHEMDMDIVEQGEWACKDLKTLRVRIKDLNTKEKILKTIALWRAGCRRRWREKSGSPVAVEVQDEMDLSIEVRVARHLLKFDKLSTVWLGYQTWTPI